MARYLLVIVLLSFVGCSTQRNAHVDDLLGLKQMPYPFYAPPLHAKTEQDIVFSVGTKSPDGSFENIQPIKRAFTHNGVRYLVVIGSFSVEIYMLWPV